jgi:thioredoxin 1
MANIPEITDETFDREVLESSGPVLVDFGAVWCGPCKMLDPLVEELAAEWQDNVKVVKLDIDQNPLVPMQYMIMGVPTLILFKDGEPMERMTGYQPKHKIVSKFEAHLSA